jgi:hypothetical protein
LYFCEKSVTVEMESFSLYLTLRLGSGMGWREKRVLEENEGLEAHV